MPNPHRSDGDVIKNGNDEISAMFDINVLVIYPLVFAEVTKP